MFSEIQAAENRTEAEDETRFPRMSSEKKKRVLRLTEAGSLALATLAFVVFVIVCGLSASPNANRYGFKNTTGDVSDKYFTQVTPAGFTFSIWTVIFIWQLLWLGYAWTFICRPNAPRTIAIGVYPAFAVSSVMLIAWMYIWGNELINWAFGVLVAFDLVIYFTISSLAFFFFANVTVANKIDVRLTQVLVLNGLSFYATWTTIAGLVNFGVVLQYTFNVNATTVGTIVLAMLTAVLLIYFSLENTILDRFARDVVAVYPVVIWALIGIVVEHWSKPGEERNSVFALVLLLVTMVLMFLRGGLLVLFYFFRKRGGRIQNKSITV